jgi:hypothetical protein
MSKEKVEGREYFTSEDAERSLETVQSEDLPENIDEIEAVVTWKLSKHRKDHSEKTSQELGKELSEMLKKANVRPIPDWDMEDLAEKILLRRNFGKTKADCLKDYNEKRNEEYERVKNREPIKRLISLCPMEKEGLVIGYFLYLDEKLKEGKSFSDLIIEEVSSNDPPRHLAFLMLVEENSSSAITTPKELVKAAKLQKIDPEYVEKSFYMAQENRYTIKIEGLIQKGASYTDLLNIEPSSFNLPKNWTNLRNQNMNAEEVISRTISMCFKLHLDSPTLGRKHSYREVADRLNAPLSVILKAARYYA